MKKELLRHIEILKTVPEIKENIEILRFWTILLNKAYYRIIKVFVDEPEACYWVQVIKSYVDDIIMPKNYIWENWEEEFNKDFIVIWQVHEWHLRMFFEKKDNRYCIMDNWIWWYSNSANRLISEVKIDNSKPYMEQSEEFFKKLNDWLEKEFNKQ